MQNLGNTGRKNSDPTLRKNYRRSESGTSSRTNLVAQATFIETAKIERLLAALVSI